LAYAKALRPGGFASVEMRVGMVTAPVLPESAVQSDERGNYVYVVDGANKVARRGVTVGDVSDTGVAITQGLQGNERIVLSAAPFLNPGDRVEPVRARAAR
jgi:HlyD family secretion protein